MASTGNLQWEQQVVAGNHLKSFNKINANRYELVAA